jgi:hypothetical protein
MEAFLDLNVRVFCDRRVKICIPRHVEIAENVVRELVRIEDKLYEMDSRCESRIPEKAV